MDSDTIDAYDTNAAFRRGLATRLAVLGPEYVDGSVARGAQEAFTHDLQQIVNEHVWGSVWSRDGLSLDKRSIVVITILAVRGQEDELALHIAGGLRNGLTGEELREIFLQIAAYAGMPACLLAFRAARQPLIDAGISPETLLSESPSRARD